MSHGKKFKHRKSRHQKREKPRFTGDLSGWREYAQRQIEDLKESERLSAKDYAVVINVVD